MFGCDFKSDDDYVYIFIGASSPTWDNFTQNGEIFHTYEDEDYKLVLSNFSGKTWVKAALEWVPVNTLTYKLKDFIDTCFNFSFQGTSENQISLCVNYYVENYNKHGTNTFDYDIISREIRKPCHDFLVNLKDQPFEFRFFY